MELTYDETLQLGNSKEHLKTVLVNIRIANEELEEVLIQIEDAKLKLKELEDQTISIQENNLIEFKKSISIKKFRITLTEKINSLVPVYEKLITGIQESEEYIKTIDSKLSELNSKYVSTIRDKEKEVKTLEEKIAGLEEEVRNCEEKIRERVILGQRIEIETINLKHEKEKEEKMLREAIADATSKLEAANKELEAEKAKIVNPLRLISEENDKLDKRYRNLEILESRLRKQFRALNPDKVLPLELKEN